MPGGTGTGGRIGRGRNNLRRSTGASPPCLRAGWVRTAPALAFLDGPHMVSAGYVVRRRGEGTRPWELLQLGPQEVDDRLDSGVVVLCGMVVAARCRMEQSLGLLDEGL